MLEGKVALVTGGGRGIGRGTALLFAREGARVVVADLSSDGARETAELIAKAGGEALSVVADISKPADVSSMMVATLGAFGQLDCAFNNAGINGTLAGARGKLTADWPEDAFDKLIRVNLKGAWLRMRAPRRVTRAGVDTIEAILAFEASVGSCNGVVRLVSEDSTQRAWTLLTTLDETRGHEDPANGSRSSMDGSGWSSLPISNASDRTARR
jgi:NAD(P)-dependent dehydrogenase (short-subunit alcohol dehydrogenase family)